MLVGFFRLLASLLLSNLLLRLLFHSIIHIRKVQTLVSCRVYFTLLLRNCLMAVRIDTFDLFTTTWTNCSTTPRHLFNIWSCFQIIQKFRNIYLYLLSFVEQVSSSRDVLRVQHPVDRVADSVRDVQLHRRVQGTRPAHRDRAQVGVAGCCLYPRICSPGKHFENILNKF